MWDHVENTSHHSKKQFTHTHILLSSSFLLQSLPDMLPERQRANKNTPGKKKRTGWLMLCCSCLLLAHWKTHSRHCRAHEAARVNRVRSQKRRLNSILSTIPGPSLPSLDDLFNNIIASPPSRRGRKAMCAKRQGFPTGLSRGASRALCSNPFSASRRSSYFAPACGGISPLPLARFWKLLFWDQSQVIYIGYSTHHRPPLTQRFSEVHFLCCNLKSNISNLIVIRLLLKTFFFRANGLFLKKKKN